MPTHEYLPTLMVWLLGSREPPGRPQASSELAGGASTLQICVSLQEHPTVCIQKEKS